VARQRFVSGLRGFVLSDLAGDLRRAYDARVAPRFQGVHGRLPADGDEVHQALRTDPTFKAYSSLRVTAQKMVWDSVTPVVARQRAALETAAVAGADRLKLDSTVKVPRSVSAIDVHFMPGSYSGEGAAEEMAPGAIYDQGFAVFSMGLMGENFNDIGRSMARYISRKFPDFHPQRILDLGCTIGHNTLPWKEAYPDAAVTGIDVAAGCLRYGAARAASQGVAVQFTQMNAEQLDLPDHSVDLVFSSMFLHELSLKSIARVFAEIRRVLRPGGLMLHMELPPNTQMGAFEGFYLDWDCYYNVEPFYKAFRDQEPRELCRKAGFAPQHYLQFVVPSICSYGESAVDAAVAAEEREVNKETTGRLSHGGIEWFGFGAWQDAAQ
jgi:ubiquinone/menaquinone biosynthesis C-methylase UbiE